MRESGQGLAEYALILALVAIVAIIAVALLGQQILQVINDAACALPPGCAATP